MRSPSEGAPNMDGGQKSSQLSTSVVVCLRNEKKNKICVVTIEHCTLGGWWRWALVSPDGVAPSRMVGVSASVNLPLHHKVQKFSSGTGSPRWSRKKGRKWLCVCVEHWLLLVQPFYGPFFWDHPGEPVQEDNSWTLWCKRRLTEADTPTIQLVPLHPD